MRYTIPLEAAIPNSQTREISTCDYIIIAYMWVTTFNKIVAKSYFCKAACSDVLPITKLRNFYRLWVQATPVLRIDRKRLMGKN